MNQKPQKVNTGLLPVGLLSVLWVTNEETSTEQISRYIEDAGNQVFSNQREENNCRKREG
jgi:hypothetical protein